MSDMKIEPIVKSPGRNTGDYSSPKMLRGTRDGVAFVSDYLMNLAMQGRVFIASDADENDTILGATSFAATTPTLCLDVPSGTTAIPLLVNLRQAGVVAGDNISVTLAIETARVRYSSGGAAETNIQSTRSDKPVNPRCLLYSAPTAAAATTAVAIHHDIIAEDVDPVSADAARLTFDWEARMPYLLKGPAAFLVFTYASATGPTWRWVVGWAEIPSSDIE